MKIPMDRSDFMRLFIGVAGGASKDGFVSAQIRVTKVEFDFIFGPLFAIDFNMRVDKVVQRFGFAGRGQLIVSAS